MLKKSRVAFFLLLLLTIILLYGISNRKSIIPYKSFISKENILYGSSKVEGNIFIPIHGSSNITDVLNSIPSLDLEKMLHGTNNGPSTRVVNIALRSQYEVLKEGDGIIFIESTDRMQLPSLVLCAIESAARLYKNRPVVFFMKGLNSTNIEETVKRNFPALSSLSNVYFFPLKMEEIFTDTPLHSWYQKIDPQQQSHWTHVSSDACRIALIWKHGGIYLDTDVISVQAIPAKAFLAASVIFHYSSNGVFGFPSHHDFTLKCMEDFVQNYNSTIWGQQGPHLFTRVLKKFCDINKFKKNEDAICGKFTFFNSQRFYPIPFSAWRKYYTVWDGVSTFNDSYAFHLFNYLNVKRLSMVPGSNTFVEYLYKEYCPSTYNSVRNNYTA